jgi:hypothetical protein
VDPLAVESRELRKAHEALDADPARALAILDAENAAQPAGQLVEARAAERVVAMCKLRRGDAPAAAASFAAKYPDSPFAARIHAACAASTTR